MSAISLRETLPRVKWMAIRAIALLTAILALTACVYAPPGYYPGYNSGYAYPAYPAYPAYAYPAYGPTFYFGGGDWHRRY